jgi:hypothetical protein
MRAQVGPQGGLDCYGVRIASPKIIPLQANRAKTRQPSHYLKYQSRAICITLVSSVFILFIILLFVYTVTYFLY